MTTFRNGQPLQVDSFAVLAVAVTPVHVRVTLHVQTVHGGDGRSFHVVVPDARPGLSPPRHRRVDDTAERVG